MSIIASQFAIFGGWNFNNVPNLQVNSTDTFKGGLRYLNIFQIARRSARKTSSAFNRSNSIQIGIYLTSPSKVALEQAMDLLFANIQTQEAQLVIPQSGGVRGYYATYSTIRINQQKGGYLDATLTFECSDSYGYDANYTVIQPATNFTAAVVNTQYTQGGSAELQAPIIQAKITALTGGTNGTVTISNGQTGQAAQIIRTWLANDILIVDCQNNIVTVNGAEVAFTGALPTTGIGTQTLTYQDTFTTRTVNLFEYVYNRWN